MNKQNLGWIHGLIGVLIFAGSLPATKLAILSFSAEFITGARAVIAGVCAILLLKLNDQLNLQWIDFKKLKSLTLVSIGVVIGFPLLTALALQTIDSSRAIIFVGLLPLVTAIFGVMRASEQVNSKFWIFSICGALSVITFMCSGHSSTPIQIGDLYMIMSIILCGLGYAEGAVLAKALGGWKVICWALILSLIPMLLVMIYNLPMSDSNIQTSSIWGLLYVSFFSMLIGFFFWYNGLALGGIAKVGQIQLIQPFIGLVFSAIILNENISSAMIFTGLAVLICVLLAKKYT